ncbi:MAG: transglycosylase SLT domain-containing protein [Bacteroidia bacterium]|nr:transglycosylase SLT domain-containing protein [Bacteroidia bacterium]
MKSTSYFISGLAILVIATLSIWKLASGEDHGTASIDNSFAYFDESQIKNITEVTVYANDSLADLWINGSQTSADDLDTMLQAVYSMDVKAIDFSCIKVIWDERLYTERWDTLAQTIFWRKVMNLPKDSLIVNVAATREIIDVVSVWDWEKKGDSLKTVYKDSIRSMKNLSANAAIYVTGGKKHYYHFDKMLRHIGEGINVFYARGIDPWYAQAILLIESPGQLQFSPVGAYGSFQLMKSVAIEQGLTVNDSVDEREDFAKAAWAAAGLIQKRCLPYVRRMLNKRKIAYKEDDPFFRMLVLHAYHAGAGNVEGALQQFEPREGGIPLMKELWRTEHGGFKNASQNYSQVAIASMIELDRIMLSLPDTICQEQDVIAFQENGMKLQPTAP